MLVILPHGLASQKFWVKAVNLLQRCWGSPQYSSSWIWPGSDFWERTLDCSWLYTHLSKNFLIPTMCCHCVIKIHFCISHIVFRIYNRLLYFCWAANIWLRTLSPFPPEYLAGCLAAITWRKLHKAVLALNQRGCPAKSLVMCTSIFTPPCLFLCRHAQSVSVFIYIPKSAVSVLLSQFSSLLGVFFLPHLLYWVWLQHYQSTRECYLQLKQLHGCFPACVWRPPHVPAGYKGLCFVDTVLKNLSDYVCQPL